jgi:hypothetical protein
MTLPGDLGRVRLDGELPDRDDLPLVFDTLDHQLATQVYLWALPLVSYARWQQQHREVFLATDYDIVHYVTYADRLGLITANATTPYLVSFIDLSRTGPLVVEVPPGPVAGGASDFWQREFAILGEMGPDQGGGGKHLILPPGVEEPPLDDEYYVHRATGMNVMFGFRTLDPDPARAQGIVDGLKMTRLDGLASPATRVLSPDGRRWDGDQPRGLAYFERLHAIYQSEIVDERDRFFLAMMRQLGIEKGAPFAPDERLQRILTQGAEAGELIAQANTFAKRFEGSRYWPDRAWDLALALSTSAQRGPDYDELFERASWFYEAVSFSEAMKSQTPGKGQAYLSAYVGSDGEWLDGGRDYTLHVPPDVPASGFWSATVYDIRTRCLIDNAQQRGDRGSRDADLARNADGSVDLFFGPSAPDGREANWVQTIPGQHWFSYFRFYGPLEPYFDRSWKLGDITPV